MTEDSTINSGQRSATTGEKKPSAAPLALYSSKSDMVTATLREMIVTGIFESGDQLRQRDLAARFNVSPTPVREALRRLEAQGLLVTDPHKGATVVAGKFGATRENYQIRAALESLAAEFAAERISPEQLAQVEAIHQELSECDPDDAVGRAELNRRLHFAIYESANSPLLIALLRLLWEAFPTGPQVLRPSNESNQQHAELIAALASGDGNLASEIVHHHIVDVIKYDDRTDED